MAASYQEQAYLRWLPPIRSKYIKDGYLISGARILKMAASYQEQVY